MIVYYGPATATGRHRPTVERPIIPENSSLLHSTVLQSTASAGRIKKLDSIHREGIRIYTGAFRISPVEALHVEANDPSLELKRNELGLRYLYKLKSNPAYIHTLNTLDDSEDQKYEETSK